MKTVLVDTGPLLAALDSSDSYHERAQGEIASLARESRGVALPFPILCESHSLVLRKLGAYQARGWLREVRGYASLFNPTSADYERAAGRVLAYSGEKLSMFDAVLAVVSERLSLPVWAYDHHFDVMGAEVWRPA